MSREIEILRRITKMERDIEDIKTNMATGKLVQGLMTKKTLDIEVPENSGGWAKIIGRERQQEPEPTENKFSVIEEKLQKIIEWLPKVCQH